MGLMASEPVEDVQQLSAAVMREVQQYKRSVIVTWDGAVERTDFMVMQQGVVANVQFEGIEDDVSLPVENSEEVLERWRTAKPTCPSLSRRASHLTTRPRSLSRS